MSVILTEEEINQLTKPRRQRAAQARDTNLLTWIGLPVVRLRPATQSA